jgi:hypothetical protein
MERVLPALEEGRAPDRRLIGLPTIHDDHEFDSLSRAFVTAICRRSLAAKPGARIVAEKTPSNSLRTTLVNHLVPDVRFLHLVRDPRDVVVSLLAARTWSPRWAPRSARRAAAMWLKHYEGAIQARVWPERYLEVRYEDLRSDTAGVLAEVFTFLGVDPADAPAVSERVGARRASDPSGGYAFSPAITARLEGRPIQEPVGFARASGGKRPALSAMDRLSVERVVGEHLRRLGYTDGATWTGVDGGQAHLLNAVLRTEEALRNVGRVALRQYVGGTLGNPRS